MNKLIIANWKMNPATVEEAVALAKAEDHEGLVICPPFPFLEAVGHAITKATLGAQDAFVESSGAYTGEVSPEELKSLGVQYVIVGHSERRRLGETDELIAKKMAAVAALGLTPILCVGENRAEHDAGKSEEIIRRQLEIDLSLVASGQSLVAIIAYEPVWAISTEPNAQADTPENAVRMINYLRQATRDKRQEIKFIYGGSVTATNAAAFLSHPELSGALVGGASLKPNEMAIILKAASHYV